MNNRSRLTALLLALLMLMSALPVPALADDVISTMDDYKDAMERLQDALSEPSIPQEQETEYTINRTTQIDTIVRESLTGVIAQEGDNNFVLPVAGRLTLSTAGAAEAWQWQINANGVWANIVGDNAAEITLTYAKIQNALSSGSVAVRCVMTHDGAVSYSPEAYVTVDMTPKTEETTVEESIPAVSHYAPAAQSQARALNANGENEPSTYTIVINYRFTDGKQAAPSWTATVATGTTYQQEIKSPAVLGYTPDQETVQVNASKEKTYTVTYKPAEVSYTVKHYQQNVDNDNYTLLDTETKTGFTEAPVGEELAKTYEGFTALLYDTTTKIAADGSTEVEIYYDRNYYLMKFNLDGGYGVDPVYAKYGTEISVGEPEKNGYSFAGWELSVPAIMPANSITIKAKWTAVNTSYTIQYWQENANDMNYSYVESMTKSAKTGANVSGSADKYYQGFYFDHADQNVVVKGDGSTVVNVYYKRNIYTVTFKDGQQVLTCTKTEHTHTSEICCNKSHFFGEHTGYGFGGTCNTDKCPVGYEHTHDNNCYKYSDLKITAKYGAFIGDQWPGGGWYVNQSRDTAQSYLAVMPMGGKTFYAKQTGSTTFTATYYVEVLPGEKGSTTVSGRDYKVHHTDVAYNNRKLSVTDEERYELEGFTVNVDISAKNGDTYGGAKFYYTRNKYELVFNDQYGTTVFEQLPYEQKLSESVKHKNGYKPTYPSVLEEGAYEFGGWYADPGCTTPVDWENTKMPAAKMVVYAKWTPVTHTVKTYLTKDAMDEGETALQTWDAVQHGTSVENPPEEPTNGNYTFVGWFYMDNDTEKAFDFSMPVNRDLDLYAKWSSNTLVEYTIKYTLENGTEIADPTKGSALAATTKTFDAKTGTQLNEGYQSGYFPKTSSHSLTMDIEGNAENKKNEFTFVYVAKPEVTYTVKYLEKGTGNQLAEPKNVTTKEAVVTETFKQITGYAPDAYQKRLVLSAEEENNVITFWYVKDEVHAPVQIIHWKQNIVGGDYTEYQSSTNLNGVIGQKYSEAPLNIPGFTYNTTESNARGTLTADGLVLNLYYDRIKYPYEFRFLEQGTNKVLADPVTGNARYEAQVTQTAKTIPGYKLVGAENQAINIAIEDPNNVASKNVKTFYYVEETVDIKYQVVGPTEGCGTLDNYQDNSVKVINGTVNGSKPTAAEAFKFVGWFKDADCKEPVDANWVTNNKLTPEKTKDYGSGSMGYEAATYYAKFEYNLTTLTITKQGMDSIDAGQSFLFRVEGHGLPSDGLLIAINGNRSETISGLTVDQTYTVTEVNSWSWRYSVSETVTTSIKLQPDDNELIINNTRDKEQWLDGDCYAENNFNAKD